MSALKKKLTILGLLVLSIFYAPQSHAVSPELAGTLSIVPGLGQAANGQVLEGLAWTVTTVGLYLSRNYYLSNVGYKLWEYNMYDAYRDAGARDAAKESVFSNYIAILNPLNIIDPIGIGILGLGTYSAINSKSTVTQGPNSLLGSTAFFGFVALGEEGLFRGFLFPAFSDLFDSKWAGATVSSAAFALSHLTNKAQFYHSAWGLSVLFLGGMALCWQTYNNNYDLRHSIFTHAWFDVIVDYGGRKGTTRVLDQEPISLGASLKVNFPL